MSEFHYQEIFELGADETAYRKLGSDGISLGEFEGRPMLKLEPEVLERLAFEAMSDTAHLLRHTLGDEMLLARFADHTFGLLCRGSNHAQTRELAERVRTAFEGHILEIGSRSATLTVSIGGVQMSEKSGAQQVLGKAGQCLQAAISEGGNRLSLFDPAARDRAA